MPADRPETCRLRCCWPECHYEWDTTLTAHDYESCPRCRSSFTINKPYTLTPTPPAKFFKVGDRVRVVRHRATGKAGHEVANAIMPVGSEWTILREATPSLNPGAFTLTEKFGEWWDAWPDEIELVEPTPPAPADDAGGARDALADLLATWITDPDERRRAAHAVVQHLHNTAPADDAGAAERAARKKRDETAVGIVAVKANGGTPTSDEWLTACAAYCEHRRRVAALRGTKGETAALDDERPEAAKGGE